MWHWRVMFRIHRNPSYPFSPLKVRVETNWKWVIRLYQGKRRVSSKAKPGTNAYFDVISNTVDGIITTIIYQRKWKFDYVVVTVDGADHGAVYAAELVEFANRAMASAEKAKWTPEYIEQVNNQRNAARIAKDFATADSLRKEMEDAGITVNDAKLTPPATVLNSIHTNQQAKD